MKRTPWISAAFNPARQGWYEVKCHYGMYGQNRERLYWNSYRWLLEQGNLTDICDFGLACDSWRGLIESPTGQQPT